MPQKFKMGVVGAWLAGLMTLQGCAPVALRAPLTPSTDVAANSPSNIRMMGADHRFTYESMGRVARRAQDARGTRPFVILALSGGGADGAFGAGALVGLSRSGKRPQYAVVTGVSVGALLAPYAFLGPEWDQQLMDAYTSGRAEHLLQSRHLGVIFGSSAYRGRPLERLVDAFLSDALMQAVAREAASGRLLLVATTNVETGETVVWDLGSVALNGGANAKALFRDILVASASVPGIFPPVIIRVHDGWGEYSEAHVDGSATAPFLIPRALLLPSLDLAHRPAPEVYVIVDGRLSEEPASIPLRFRPIVSHSISAALTHMMRTTLELTATNAQLQGASFQYSAIPTAYPTLAAFDFRAASMRSLFQFGVECADSNRLWVSSQHEVSDRSDRGKAASGPNLSCPADDDFIAGLAAR
ncbi:MAG: patatin-like phospholipase family protein [Steroidobacteraceae bacterium]